MAFALVAQAKGNGNDTYSTGSANTTGANLLILTFADVFADASPPTISDTIGGSPSGNTWLEARDQSPFGQASRIFYVQNPTVGASHVVTLTGTDQIGSAQFTAWSGAATSGVLDQTNENLAFSAASVQPGSVTPTENGELIVAHVTFDTTPSMPTVNSGFLSPAYGDIGQGAVYLGSGMTYLIQATAAAVNPTITRASGTGHMYATIATFKAGAAGGSVTGTAAASFGGLTATVAGTRTVVAVVAASFGGLTAVAVATRTVTGTINQSFGALTATVAGTAGKTGTAASSFGGVTATASGTRTVTATAIAALGALTATGTDGNTGNVNGAATANLGALTATAGAAVQVNGVAAASLGALTATATGDGDKVGVASAALGALAATVTALRIIQGVAAANLGGLTAAASVNPPQPSVFRIWRVQADDRTLAPIHDRVITAPANTRATIGDMP